MKELAQLRLHPQRIFPILIGLLMLAAMFILQQADVLRLLCSCMVDGTWHFVFNKTLRLIVNDIAMLVIIRYWFGDKKILKLALLIQAIDLLVMLPAYFLIKLSIEGDSEISSPLLSQLHRLIVNPTLMILLFPAIYFQRFYLKANT